MKKFPALGSVLALALVGSIATVPAIAKTHHHKAHHSSTTAEKAQTADLNKQQLAIAQGQAPANQQAMNGAAQQQQQQQQQPAQNQNQNVPADQTMNGGQTAQAPSAPNGTSPSQQPAPQPNNTQAPPPPSGQ
jgi:hypothetical protein